MGETSLADTRATITHIAGIDPTNTLITPILTPRFAPSCSRDLMNGLGALQKETDMSGGYSPSILEAVRQAALVSNHVAMGGDDSAKLSVEEVLYLATRGGANVVGLGEKIGGFGVGMEWDAQLIGMGQVGSDEKGDTGPVDIFGWESWDERIAKWVFNGDDRNTLAVWVKGRLVHERILQ